MIYLVYRVNNGDVKIRNYSNQIIKRRRNNVNVTEKMQEEDLLERLEVISNTVDEMRYLIESKEGRLEGLRHKLHVRVLRMEEEVECVDDIVSDLSRLKEQI